MIIYGTTATFIYIFLGGLFAGHILAGFCYSNFTQWVVDRIETHIAHMRANRRAAKAERQWLISNKEYIKNCKRMKNEKPK